MTPDQKLRLRCAKIAGNSVVARELYEFITEKYVTGRAAGGMARAAKLSPGERKRIAEKAASARWLKKGSADNG